MSSSEYDKFSADFSDTRQHEWPEFNILKPLLKKYDRLLDLGCGNGRLRRFIDKNLLPDGNYFGFDISQGLLDIARRDHPQDHFFRGSFAEKLPFGADNFEIIASVAAFHHLLNKKDQKACLAELHRILKPGGTLFLTTWKIPRKNFKENLKRWDFWRSNWQNYLVPFGKEKHPRMYRMVPASVLKRLLKKAGFEIISSELCRGRNWVVVARKPK